MTMKLFLTLVVVVMTTMMPMLDAAVLAAKRDKADDDYAPIDFTHIDPVDLCLFVCHSCFEQVGLRILIFHSEQNKAKQ